MYSTTYESLATYGLALYYLVCTTYIALYPHLPIFFLLPSFFLLVPDTAYTIAHGKCFSRSLPFLYDFSATEAALRINRGSCGMTERLSLTL